MSEEIEIQSQKMSEEIKIHSMDQNPIVLFSYMNSAKKNIFETVRFKVSENYARKYSRYKMISIHAEKIKKKVNDEIFSHYDENIITADIGKTESDIFKAIKGQLR